MDRFGDALRSEREQRGLTLEDVSAITKISVRNLAALEAEQFTDLPGGVFRKGIARGYTDALGLDQTVWLERFESSLHRSGISTEVEGDLTQFAHNVKRSRGGPQRGMGLRWLGVLALLLLLGGGGYLAWRYVLAKRIVVPHSFGSIERVGSETARLPV